MVALLTTGILAVPVATASAEPDCQDVLLVFARGSDQGFRAPEAETFFGKVGANIGPGIEYSDVELGNLDGDFIVEDGEYSAVPRDNWVAAESTFDWGRGALGGYLDSTGMGSEELTNFLMSRVDRCPAETLVLGGYSQGADVVGLSLASMPGSVLDNIGYVALFGDPRFNKYGWWTQGDYSWYHAGGSLSPRSPYLPSELRGRAGSWCDQSDGICTGVIAQLLDGAHHEYAESEILNAANKIAVKLRELRPNLGGGFTTTPLPIAVRPTDNVDVTFVVDTSGSMIDDIDAAQTSIAEVANSLFSVAASPRVSLVEYRDVDNSYQARIDSPFTADPDAFAAAVNSLRAGGGRDFPESVYSGLMTSFTLDWRPGALKLAILIGDAPAKNPEPVTDYTLEQVLRTAFELDPVVINPIVVGNNSATVASFTQLADGSGGKVYNATDASQVVAAIEEAVEGFSSAPVAQASGPYTAAPGDEITFTGAGSFDPAGEIVNYAWDFNSDGVVDQEGDSPVVTYAYDAPYTGLASLTVTNTEGRTNVGTAEVTVAEGEQLPQPPGAPTNVTAVDAGDGVVELTWQPPTDAGDGELGGYRVYREDGLLLALRPVEEASLRVEGVPVGQAVSFTVEALNLYGPGPQATSEPITLGESTAPAPAPSTCAEADESLAAAEADLAAKIDAAQTALGETADTETTEDVADRLRADIDGIDPDGDGLTDDPFEQEALDEALAQLAAVQAVLDSQAAVEIARTTADRIVCTEPDGEDGNGSRDNTDREDAPDDGPDSEGDRDGPGHEDGGGGTDDSGRQSGQGEGGTGYEDDASRSGHGEPDRAGQESSNTGSQGGDSTRPDDATPGTSPDGEFSQVGDVPVGAVDTGSGPSGSTSEQATPVGAWWGARSGARRSRARARMNCIRQAGR